MGDLHPPNPPENNGPPLLPAPPLPPSVEIFLPCSSSKRQRRPSVRLGEIGDQRTPTGSVDPSSRRPKISKLHAKDSGAAFKPSYKPKASAGVARRVRTNWFSRFDDGFDAAALAPESKSIGGEDAGGEDYVDDCESPLNRNDRRASNRVRLSDGGDDPSEEGCRGWVGSVRSWLERLGLGRYWPIFEMHEVDDEVLPLLTLEDLRDMGINAVGSRRKMYCAIQKLGNNKDSSEGCV
ncbi:hypothetical protein AXF42_Ash011388 [Apostasia shenzhenica]|uniref:SAM domain-containing protein n=1 Tax=Apostasia shenzhenica TaxID=1088818 RepID=A0A2I0AEE3_9ASPA|nr:hypothetical protein AXF42_Ash011388 [Apostasia shenzhenica]